MSNKTPPSVDAQCGRSLVNLFLELLSNSLSDIPVNLMVRNPVLDQY